MKNKNLPKKFVLTKNLSIRKIYFNQESFKYF